MELKLDVEGEIESPPQSFPGLDKSAHLIFVFACCHMLKIKNISGVRKLETVLVRHNIQNGSSNNKLGEK